MLIALRYLLLAKLVSRLFLPQQKQLILLPVALQSLRDLLLAGLNPAIPICLQFPEIAFSIQNRFQDGLPCHPTDVADHIDQLDIHLRQRLLHALNMTTTTAHQILTLPPVSSPAANRLRRRNEFRNKPYVCSFINHWLSCTSVFLADSSSRAHSPDTLPDPPATKMS